MDSPAILGISRIKDVYQFQLEMPRERTVIRRYVTPPISSQNQNSLNRAVEQVARGEISSYTLGDLGYLLFNLLLNDELKTCLRELQGPLIISTDAPDMPWELLNVGGEEPEFLGLKCAVGRRLVTEFKVAAASSTNISASSSQFLLIGDPQRDLNGAIQEISDLNTLLALQGMSSRVLVGNRARLLTVQLELQKANSLVGIHFAGHADYHQQLRQNCLLLSDGAVLTVEMIYQLCKGVPFVFLNACGTGKGSRPEKRAPLASAISDDLSTAFIQAGSLGVIGTRWEVDDASSSAFAMMFYQSALQGIPIGESLRLAKVRFRQEYTNDSTWAAFLLYGDPTQQLIPPPPIFTFDGEINRTRLSSAVAEVFEMLPREAHRLGHEFISTPILLITLLRRENGLIRELLQTIELTPSQLCQGIAQRIATTRNVAEPQLFQAHLSRRVQLIMTAAEQQAQLDHVVEVREDHLLLSIAGLLGGATVQLLSDLGINVEKFRLLLQRKKPLSESIVGQNTTLEPTNEDSGLLNKVKLSEDSRLIFAIAQAEAHRQNCWHVLTPHLVIALTKLPGGLTGRVLAGLGHDPKLIRGEIRRAISLAVPRTHPLPPGKLAAIAPHVESILELAVAAAEEEGVHEIGEYHLLIGFLRMSSSSRTARFLRRLGVDMAIVAEVARKLRQNHVSGPQ